MTRKWRFLKAAGALLGGLLMLPVGVAAASSVPSRSASGHAAMPHVVLKFSCPCSSAPPMAPQTEEMYRIAKVMKTLTHGAVDIEVYPNGSLVPAAQELEAAQNNTVQLIETSGDEYEDIAGGGMIYQTPYLFTRYAQEVNAWKSTTGQNLVHLIDKKLGVHILGILDLGARELDLNTTNHINTPADLKGVKLRMPGGPYWATLGTALGGNVTPIAFTEIYLSLQTGVIQAQDNPLPSDVADKFYEVTKQIVLTNHVIEPLQPAISDAAWKQLSPVEQTDLEQTFTKQDNWESKKVIHDQDFDIRFLKKKGLKVYSPDISAFRKPVLKAFLCDPSFVNPILQEAHGLLNYALKESGGTRPSC